MKIVRYKKPSVRNLTGYTKVKRKVKRASGISKVQAYTKPSRVKQKIKYEGGLYSKPIGIIRNTSHGKLPSFLGLFTKRK